MALNRSNVVLSETEYSVLKNSFSLDELLQLDYLIELKSINRYITINNKNSIIDNCYPLYKYHFYKGRNLRLSGHYLEIDYSLCIENILRDVYNIPVENKDIKSKILFSRKCISYVRNTISTDELKSINQYTEYLPSILKFIYNYINKLFKLTDILNVFEIVAVSDFRIIAIYKGVSLKNDILKFATSQYKPQIFAGYNETYRYLKEEIK